MARIRTKHASASVKFGPFGGIDRRGVIREMENLRPGADGMLRRRGGYLESVVLEGEVRGVWSGSFDGEEAVFAVAGNVLYRLDLTAGTSTALGTVAEGEGRVALFLWRGKLCCMDGAGIWLWDGAVLNEAQAYVPLVGRERGPMDMYDVYEPINLIGRRARFSFRATGDHSGFYFGMKVDSMVSLYDASNGFPYFSSDYRLSTDSYGNSYIQFNSVPAAGKVILAVVTLSAQYFDYARIAACTDAVVYGGSYDDRILCWGGGGAAEMFCSQPVSEAALEEARIWGNVSGEMYFPRDCNFHIGDGRYPLRAAARHHDRLLIFTAGDTWMADFSATLDTQMPVVPINSGVGCLSRDGAALCGNDPLTVADGGVWRWSSSALRRDECSAACISGGIGELFGAGFADRAVAYTCRRRGEVWFVDPADAEGRVFVYSTEREVWYCFSGVQADALFGWDGEVAFRRGSRFFRFAEESEPMQITPVRLALGGIVFGEGEGLRHTTRLALAVRGTHPALALVLESDLGRVRRVVIPAGGNAEKDSVYDMPLRSGRFRALSVTLEAEGAGALCIKSLTLTAEPEE